MSLNKNNDPRHQLVHEGKKMALCRCWQSKKFPFCDGSHRAYNAEHDDQLGPVIIESEE